MTYGYNQRFKGQPMMLESGWFTLVPGRARRTPSLPFSPPQFNPIGKVDGRELSRTYSDVFLEMGLNVVESTSVM